MGFEKKKWYIDLRARQIDNFGFSSPKGVRERTRESTYYEGLYQGKEVCIISNGSAASGNFLMEDVNYGMIYLCPFLNSDPDGRNPVMIDDAPSTVEIIPGMKFRSLKKGTLKSYVDRTEIEQKTQENRAISRILTPQTYPEFFDLTNQKLPDDHP